MRKLTGWVMVIGEVITNEKGFPSLEISSKNVETDECGKTYYLHPFRGYSFQVSGSQDGNGSYGSSTVVGIGNVLRMPVITEDRPSDLSIYSSNIQYKNFAKEFLISLAYQAMFNHCSTVGIVPEDYFGCCDDNKLLQLIDLTIEYIANLM